MRIKWGHIFKILSKKIGNSCSQCDYPKTRWTTTLRGSRVPGLPSRVVRTDAVAGFPWSEHILSRGESLLDQTHPRGPVHSSALPFPSSFSGDHSGFFHVMIYGTLFCREWSLWKDSQATKERHYVVHASRCLLCGYYQDKLYSKLVKDIQIVRTYVQ